jgi:hypothetical protein
VSVRIKRYVLTEDGQPDGVNVGHGLYVYHARIPGVDRTSCVLGTITEITGAPNEPIEFPFIGEASMAIMNIAPRDDGVVDLMLTINWQTDIFFRLQLLWFDDRFFP